MPEDDESKDQTNECFDQGEDHIKPRIIANVQADDIQCLYVLRGRNAVTVIKVGAGCLEKGEV